MGYGGFFRLSRTMYVEFLSLGSDLSGVSGSSQCPRHHVLRRRGLVCKGRTPEVTRFSVLPTRTGRVGHPESVMSMSVRFLLSTTLVKERVSSAPTDISV